MERPTEKATALVAFSFRSQYRYGLYRYGLQNCSGAVQFERFGAEKEVPLEELA